MTQGTDAAAGIGPYIVDGDAAARTITLKSAGATQVANPAFDANLPDGGGNPRNRRARLRLRRHAGAAVRRRHAGSGGQRHLDRRHDHGSHSRRHADRAAEGRPLRGRRRTLRARRRAPTVMGVTLTVATPAFHASRPPSTVTAGQSIQAAIDAAAPGDLVLVAPGTYEELVIMDKPVRLQGWGAPSTIINAVKTPAEKMQAWRDRVVATLTATPAYLLDFQATQLAGALPPDQTGELLAPILGGEGAAVTVLGENLPLLGASCPQVARPFFILGINVDPNGARAYGLQVESGQIRAKARIDGFGLTGSDQAAGVEVNANACNLEVLNNRIYSNTGDFASGVKIGHPGAIPELADDGGAQRPRLGRLQPHPPEHAASTTTAAGRWPSARARRTTR